MDQTVELIRKECQEKKYTLVFLLDTGKAPQGRHLVAHGMGYDVKNLVVAAMNYNPDFAKIIIAASKEYNKNLITSKI